DRSRWQQCRGGLYVASALDRTNADVIPSNTGSCHMASIHKDIPIDAQPADVWAAVRDFGAVHQRLAPGFVIDARLDGDARIVTFANGNVAREQLVDCDEARRRLVYAIANERVTHYSASVQVLADGETRSRLIWIV